jgi:hypothetical protein
MLRRASLVVLFVVLLPATVQAFDHHHHHSSSSGDGGGCSSSSSSSHWASNGGSATAAPSPSPTPAGVSGMRVFVTETTYSGALGGLDSADRYCRAAANSAALTGTYRAWLSDSTTDALDRITIDGPWYTTGGELAWGSKAELPGPPLSPLLSPSGGDVLGAGASGPWTGTDANGAATGQDCDDWTNATTEVSATLGTAKMDDTNWGGGAQALRCNAKAPLICFQIL